MSADSPLSAIAAPFIGTQGVFAILQIASFSPFSKGSNTVAVPALQGPRSTFFLPRRRSPRRTTFAKLVVYLFANPEDVFVDTHISLLPVDLFCEFLKARSLSSSSART